jgi:hypothetical protein
MIPGTPKEPLAQRLWRDMAAQLAERLGCCPIHGIPLICAFCDVTTCGSAAAHLEMEALLDRAAVSRMTWPMWPCARCDTQDVALCLDCYEPVREQALASLSSEEGVRLRTLLGTSMRYTFLPAPDAADHDHDHLTGQRSPHERRETS